MEIKIADKEEISNIISVILKKRGIKTVEMLKAEVYTALTDRGYEDEKIIKEWLEYIE